MHVYAQAMWEVSKIDALNFQGDGMLWVKYLHGCFEWIEWPVNHIILKCQQILKVFQNIFWLWSGFLLCLNTFDFLTLTPGWKEFKK